MTNPERIMQLSTAHWAGSVFAAAIEHKIFTHIARGATTAAQISERAAISGRGAQALVDGLLGLGLLTIEGGELRNSPDAGEFLVEGSPRDMSSRGMNTFKDMVEWSRLGEVVKTGVPVSKDDLQQPELQFWEALVLGIAPMTIGTAQFAAGPLAIESAGAISILDIGGGSGAFSGTLLQRAKEAKATQLDWPNVNRIGRGFVAKLGVGDRFATIDGDFHTTPLGGPYDLAIYSHIAHQEAPESNLEIFGRVKAALKSGGRFVVVDFVVPDGRAGISPFTGLFHSNMLLHTKGGAVWTEGQYRAWLTSAGFTTIATHATPGPATIIIAS